MQKCASVCSRMYWHIVPPTFLGHMAQKGKCMPLCVARCNSMQFTLTFFRPHVALSCSPEPQGKICQCAWLCAATCIGIHCLQKKCRCRCRCAGIPVLGLRVRGSGFTILTMPTAHAHLEIGATCTCTLGCRCLLHMHT